MIATTDAQAAWAYRLDQARQLLIQFGYVERPDGTFMPPASVDEIVRAIEFDFQPIGLAELASRKGYHVTRHTSGAITFDLQSADWDEVDSNLDHEYEVSKDLTAWGESYEGNLDERSFGSDVEAMVRFLWDLPDLPDDEVA